MQNRPFVQGCYELCQRVETGRVGRGFDCLVLGGEVVRVLWRLPVPVLRLAAIGCYLGVGLET